MNETDDQLREVIPLLKEYTDKLGTRDTPSDQAYAQKLLPPARRLAQFVSQKINSVTDDTLRLELELRLAEFEAALQGVSIPNFRNSRAPS